MLMLIKADKYHDTYSLNFNTSHVNVNLENLLINNIVEANFNTSHVNVNQQKQLMRIRLSSYFNTSHVNVNR